MFRDLVLKTRSVRRFEARRLLPMGVLEELVDLARQTPSATNRQPLRYVLINDRAMSRSVDDCLTWAGALKDWHTQPAGEEPAAYIIILRDTAASANASVDVGIAAQTILLAAAEQGVAGCMLGWIQREKLAALLHIPDGYAIELVVALGYPVEKVVLEPMESGNFNYWRDEQAVHHVPKRSMSEIILAKWEDQA